MPQQIGLSAVFTTRNFSAGLQNYISGLNRAIQATTMAAAAISQQANPFNNVLGGPQFAQNVAAYSAGLTNAVANTRAAAQAITNAIRGIPPLPVGGIPGAVGGGVSGGGVGGGRGAGRTPAQQDLRIQKLLHDEVKDIADLERQRLIILNQTSSPLQRQIALRKEELLLARSVVRQQELLQAGISQNILSRLRGTPRTPSTQQRDAEIFKLQQEELRDLIVLEQSRRIVASRTATEYQKQLALLNQQAAQSRQGFRQQRLLQLGVSQGDIDKLRSIPVVLKDLQGAATRAAAATQNLSAKTIALGVAAGTLAVSATRALARSISAMTRSVVETVSFFDNLAISVEFYAVRALKASGVSTDYETALRLVGKEAEGTLIWIQRLAVESPFTARDVGTLFRTAQAYGLLREEALLLTPLLIDFAAAAGLSSEILERLALAIGQVRARGKLTGEEVRQLGNSGIPIRDILVKQLNIANEEFDEMVESGALLSGVVIPAIVQALEEYRGAARRVQFETLGGIVNAFKELAEFATFRFFSGVLAPIKEEMLDLFNVLNQTNIAARITAIGEAVGRGLGQALRAATVTIKLFIQGWQALDPVVKRSIILFGLSAVAVTLFAGAVGLLVLALKLLVNRIALTMLGVTLFITAWTNGFKSIAEIAVSTGNLIGAVFGGISNLFSSFFRGLSIGDAPSALGRTIGDDLNRGFRETQGEIKHDIKEEVDSVGGDALIAGSAAGAEFLKGWKIPNPAKVISEELQEALNRFGGGPQLSIAGADAVNQFLEPFKSIDIQFFDDIGSKIRGVLANAVNLGEIEETDLPNLLFGGRRAVAEALNEFRRIGSISRRTLDSVRNNAGSAGTAIVGFLQTYTRLATVTDVVEATQEKLNSITQKYKDIITPIRKELEAISELRRQSDENEEILALQRTLNNEAVSGARKRTASLRIEEIRRGATLRGLENERELQTEIANDELSAAQKLQTTLQGELDLLKARFDAQQATLNIVGDEASLFRQIQEEISKLRDKEKTDLEKQLELLGLMNEELDSAKKIAKAKFDLASGETTEFEKQQALLVLQTEEFAGQQRLLKATELGFDPAILTQLRDVPVFLSDIGEFSGDAAFNFETINDLSKDLGLQLPDLVKFADDWNIELGKARQWWVDIQTEISETTKLINDNLPSFAKIFPEQPGGVPPIIENINGLTLAIAGLIFFAPQILGIIGVLAKLGSAIAGLGSGGAAAAAAGGAAAAAGGGTLVGRVLGFLGPVGAIAGVGLLIKGEIDEARTNLETSVSELENVLSSEASRKIAERAQQFTADISGGSAFFHTFDAEAFELSVSELVKTGLQSGQSTEEIQKAIEDQVVAAYGQKFSDLPKVQEALASFNADIGTLIGTGTSAAIQVGISGLSQDPVLDNLLSTQMQTLAENGIAAGLNPIALADLIRGNFQAGVDAGLVSDTPETRAAVTKYIRGLITLMREESQSESPSKLFRDEVGVDLGLGILAGIELMAESVEKSTQLKKIMEAIAAPFAGAAKTAIETLGNLKKDSNKELTLITSGLTTIYTTFFSVINGKFVTFRTEQRNAWVGIRSDANVEVVGIKDDVLRIMEELRKGISELMSKIHALIITDGFVKIRTDAEREIGLMRINVVAALVGPEDSLLSDLQKAIGGVEAETPAWNIGKSLIAGMAQGVTDNTDLLIKAFKASIAKTFAETAKEYEVQSPSKVAARNLGQPLSEGVAVGIMSRIPMVVASMQQMMARAMGVVSPSNMFPSNRATFTPQSVSNVSRTQNFNLNVGTNQSSQGVIGDFTVMRAMMSGA